MSSDMEEGECFSDYSECQRCGKSFANCKAWGNHIKSCYQNYNTRANKHSSMSVTTNSSYSSELQHEETDHLSLDLTSYLSGGWGKKRKRGSFGTSPSTSSSLSVDHENKIVLQIGDSFNKKRKPVVEKKLQEQSKLDKKFKVGAMKQEKGLDHALDHDIVLQLGYSFNKKKKELDVKKELQESSNLDKKFKVGAMKQEEGIDHQEKYTCKKCGLEFDDFRGLGGHVSFHNRKSRKEEEGDHEESKGKKNNKEAHQCDQCDKSFPTGQALGGHKRVHWNGHLIKRFDLNQLPPEAKFFGE